MSRTSCTILRTWFGIWTPEGWRVHKKRWGNAKCLTHHLSGDGKTTIFPARLLDPETGQVEWQDDLHLEQDSFTDAGIYPADPRVEYPIGTPRWAVSHTLLCYPVADHNLHTHEYTWDLEAGNLRDAFPQACCAGGSDDRSGRRYDRDRQRSAD